PVPSVALRVRVRDVEGHARHRGFSHQLDDRRDMFGARRYEFDPSPPQGETKAGDAAPGRAVAARHRFSSDAAARSVSEGSSGTFAMASDGPKPCGTWRIS